VNPVGAVLKSEAGCPEARARRVGSMRTIEEDLANLSPDDLQRVCRWAEDRLVNAVTPLALHLQLDERGESREGHTLAAARWAVIRILEAVEEVRRISGDGGSGTRSVAPVKSIGPACAPVVPLAARRSLLPPGGSLPS
jgi:hypothetical protein